MWTAHDVAIPIQGELRPLECRPLSAVDELLVEMACTIRLAYPHPRARCLDHRAVTHAQIAEGIVVRVDASRVFHAGEGKGRRRVGGRGEPLVCGRRCPGGETMG